VTLRNGVVAVAPGTSVGVTDWFQATDPDGDPITQYRFSSDSTLDNGYFTVGGFQQDAIFTIDAAQLADTLFHSAPVASPGGTVEGVTITALDGALEGAASEFLSVYTTENRLTTVTAPDATVALGQAVAATTLFTAADLDGDEVWQFYLIDHGDSPTSGYFTLNGLRQASSVAFTVSPQSLGLVQYVGGDEAGYEMVSIGAYSFLTPNISPASTARFSIRSGTPGDGAGNDAAGALPVDVSAVPSVFSDAVGDADASDYYQLSVGADGNLALAVTGLAGDVDLQLLATDGSTVLASSRNAGLSGESITLDLTAGTYYARIIPVAGDDTSYQFAATLFSV
jgi:hypothetical protein